MIGKLICELRRSTFFCLDQLKGGVVKKAYQNLKTLDDLSSNSPQLLDYQQSALKNLLEHATGTTEFYSHLKGSELTGFPVINKEIIRNHKDNFISKNYKKDLLFTAYTSGSTGTPFCCYQDKIKRKHVIAELIFYSEKVGYRLGNTLIQVMGNNTHNQRSRLKQWIRNHKVILISKYDDKTIEEILNEINSSSEAAFLGYASTFDSLKSYFQKNGSSLVNKRKIKGIISNGQILFDETRESMEEAFDCRCYSRYSNEENGILGIDGVENNVFLLNEAHYVIEILKMNRNEPVKEGEVGRIILTDLYNHAMPMIRYDTGDIGSITYLKQGNSTKRAINNFGGRKMDMIFDCDGNVVYPHVIAEHFEHFPEIKQFQIIQESKKQYRLRVNTEEKILNHEKLKDIFRQFLGEETHIIIERVEEIPILSSGKRKMMINLIK